MIHQRLVTTGKLSREHGKALNWLFELRGVGDYRGIVHVSGAEVERAIDTADKFLHAIRSLLDAESG